MRRLHWVQIRLLCPVHSSHCSGSGGSSYSSASMLVSTLGAARTIRTPAHFSCSRRRVVRYDGTMRGRGSSARVRLGPPYERAGRGCIRPGDLPDHRLAEPVTVSVIVPTFNRPHWHPRVYDCFVSQDYP